MFKVNFDVIIHIHVFSIKLAVPIDFLDHQFVTNSFNAWTLYLYIYESAVNASLNEPLFFKFDVFIRYTQRVFNGHLKQIEYEFL